MIEPGAYHPVRQSMKQKWQRFVQTSMWKMDIHPSAWIAATALIDRTWPRGIHIAANCVIEHDAVILSHDMARGLYLDTWIGEGARIGARAIVLPGLKIGNGAVIEPGSLVNRSVPDGGHVMGNPARPMHKFDEGLQAE